MARAHDVAAAEDITAGELTPVRLGRSTIVLTRLPCGALRAFSGRCPHHGARLEFGCITGLAQGPAREEIAITREGEVLRCPWHGFEFDLRSGDPAVSAPQANALRLRFFDAEERDGRVVVAL